VIISQLEFLVIKTQLFGGQKNAHPTPVYVDYQYVLYQGKMTDLIDLYALKVN
jgi:hypothetical protein